MNPLDYIPERVKSELLDKALTKLADRAERSGSSGVAQALRNLRNDTPFVEDVFSGLQQATARFDLEWRPRDRELTDIVVAEVDRWSATDLAPRSAEFVGALAAYLLTSTEADNSPEWTALRDALRQVVAGRVPGDRVEAGLAALLAAVRNEMFTHPKLREVHSLLLQRTQVIHQAAVVDGQAQMIQALQAIRSDLSSIGATQRRELDASPPGGEERLISAEKWSSARTIHLVAPAPIAQPPDVLTPAIDEHDPLIPAWTPLVGAEGAEWLGQIQQRVTHSIEQADFVAQESIAKDLLDADLPHGQLRTSGFYLLGEAKRLQADFSEPGLRTSLLVAAADAYGSAIELGGSVRALRGLGRVQEVQGDVGGALESFRRARVSALQAYTDGRGGAKNEAAHEALRATRHYVACICQASTDSRSGSPMSHSKITQIRGAIAESHELHREILPRFSANARWRQIEWFMGLVLLGRAYTVVGDHLQSWLCFTHALAARMEMMDPTRHQFSSIERGNLLWWLRSARSTQSPAPDFHSQLEILDSAVRADDTSVGWQLMRDIVWPIRSPWLSTSEGT